MKSLPDKPSELLKLAMHDLELCEQDERYEIDMGTWHRFSYLANKCHVCLAGAVMANTKKSSVLDCLDPLCFGMDFSKFRAINYFRLGDIDRGFLAIGIRNKELIPGYYMDDNVESMSELSFNNRPEWKLHMATIIGILEANDL